MIEILKLKNVIEKQEIEIVERKGLGHPDSLCDGIAEEISKELCKYYLKNFGGILHHNVDKLLLVAGETLPKFKGGDILKPITLVLAGRATKEYDNEKIPVDEISLHATKEYLKEVLPNLDLEAGLVIEPKIQQGSTDLKTLFQKNILANDTSFGVGFAPLSELEKIVLELENFLNSSFFKKEHPYLGSDIKVMGLRIRDKIKITVAGAFISKFIESLEDYKEKKEIVFEKMRNFIEKNITKEFELYFNTADNFKENSIYLTLSGSSAECGDDGEVGRGNRANGLITPCREMSLEASAGKNPKTHTGKIYNLLANKVAFKIYEELGVKEVNVKILSQIGKPIKEPLIFEIKIYPFEKELVSKAREIALFHLENIEEITKEAIEGKVKVF